MASLTDTPPAAEVASRLRFAVMRMSRVLRQHAPADVSQSQLATLTTLVRAGRMSARDLADAERVQPPTMTRIVDALVAHGLAERATDEHDRRVVWISATPEGHALIDQVRHRRDTYLARRLRALDPDDLAALTRAAELLEELSEDSHR